MDTATIGNRCPLCGKPDNSGRIIKTWETSEGETFCCFDCIAKMELEKSFKRECVEVVNFYG